MIFKSGFPWISVGQTMQTEKIVTIPNILSAYRMAMAPVIVLLALFELRLLFIVFLVVSLVSDIADGVIARAFKIESKFGARLDSIADDLTYIAAIVGVFQFKYREIENHIPIFYSFIGLLILTTLIPILKFGRTPAFHLYSFRLAGYVQGVFIFTLFVFGFNLFIYYFTFALGILACIEVIAVALVVDSPVTNARGLYWVLRDQGAKRT